MSANGPSAIVYGGGFVWVANSLADTVSQIDPQKNGGQEVATIDVGNGPTGVAYGLGSGVGCELGRPDDPPHRSSHRGERQTDPSVTRARTRSHSGTAPSG